MAAGKQGDRTSFVAWLWRQDEKTAPNAGGVNDEAKDETTEKSASTPPDRTEGEEEGERKDIEVEEAEKKLASKPARDEKATASLSLGAASENSGRHNFKTCGSPDAMKQRS